MKLLLIVFIISILMIASIPIFVSAAPVGNDGVSRVISVLGIAKVQGQDVIVDILVEVQPGANAKEVAHAALAAQGARPFESASLGSDGFTRLGAFEPWDVLPVDQYYNPGSSDTKPEPTRLNGNGQTALTDTHTTWDGVTTSEFDINFSGITTRCPSLVDECPEAQSFDGNNDVAWLRLPNNVLGVTWFGTDDDEADMALNVRFKWNDGCVDVRRSFDAQSVFLHENGHVVGLGHSDIKEAVMYPSYQGARCILDDDDKEGTTYLYDSIITGSVSGTITDGSNPIVGAKVELEDTSLSATTEAGGIYTISNVPDPVTYTVTASAVGFETATIPRLPVDGAETLNFDLTPTGGGGSGGTITATDAYVTYKSKGGRLGVTVTLLDESDPNDKLLVPNTTVKIELSLNDSPLLVSEKTTNDNGEAKWNFVGAPKGTYTTIVLQVDGDDWMGTTHDETHEKKK